MRVHDMCDQFGEMPNNQPAAEVDVYNPGEHAAKLHAHLQARGIIPKITYHDPKPLFGADSSSEDELEAKSKAEWYWLDSKNNSQGPVLWEYVEVLGKSYPDMMIWKKGQGDWEHYKNLRKSMSGTDLWWYKIGDKEMGPIGTWEIINKVTSGQLSRKTLVINAKATDDKWRPCFEWDQMNMLDKSRGGYETVVPEMLDEEKYIPDHYKLHLKESKVVINDVQKIDQDIHLSDKLDPWPDLPGEPPGEVLQACAGPGGWHGFVPWRGLVGEVIYNWPESDIRLVKVEAPNPETMDDTNYYIIISTTGLVTYKHHQTANKSDDVDRNTSHTTSVSAKKVVPHAESTEQPLKKRKVEGGIVIVPRKQQPQSPFQSSEADHELPMSEELRSVKLVALDDPELLEEGQTDISGDENPDKLDDAISGDEDITKDSVGPVQDKNDFMKVPNQIWKPMRAPNRELKNKWDLPGEGWKPDELG